MLIRFDLQKDGTAERLQLQTSVPHQSMCIFKAGLSSQAQVYMMAGKNIKKYLMRQIPIKMLTQHAIPNSSARKLKIHQKDA